MRLPRALNLNENPAQFGIFFSANRLKSDSLLAGYLSCLRKRLKSEVVLEITLTIDDVIHLDIINACFGASSKFCH
nr:MAG: hypothetical protein BECKFM1743A_GA0114220_106521 [Candidatus Kentron sp. FM]